MIKNVKKIFVGVLSVGAVFMSTFNSYATNVHASKACVHNYATYSYYTTEQTGGYNHRILTASYPGHPEWNEYGTCFVQCEDLVYNYSCTKCGAISSHEYKRESVEEHTDSRCPNY